MRQRRQKTVLFLGAGDDSRCRSAEAFFNAVAGGMGLAWQAFSKMAFPEQEVPSAPMPAVAGKDASSAHHASSLVTGEDLERADRVVALGSDEFQKSLREKFPAIAGKLDLCRVGDGQESAALLEREIMALVARLLGGGEPRESQSVEPPETESASLKEPARKPVTLKVGRETSGRRGKGVTTVFDLPFGEDAVRELATLLKQRCGTGGTVKDGRIEIQGDQRERIIAELERLGYKVKRVGG
jgi:translation initiation factor 1